MESVAEQRLFAPFTLKCSWKFGMEQQGSRPRINVMLTDQRSCVCGIVADIV